MHPPKPIAPARSMLSLLFAILLAVFGNSRALAGAEPRFFPPLDTPREQLLIKGWKFHRGDLPGAEAAAFDDSTWRTVNLPHDWSVEPAQEVKAIQTISVIQGDWRFCEGDDERYAAPDFNDTGWKTVGLPALMGDFKPNTYRWFRKTVVLAPEVAAQEVEFNLGRILDCDELYINGKKVAETGVMPKNQPQGKSVPAGDQTRCYRIPAKMLKPGSNQFAICVYHQNVAQKKKENATGPSGSSPGGFASVVPGETGEMERVGPFFRGAIGGVASGFTLGGTSWYRKHFTVDPADVGKHFEVVFGGVSMNAEVWVNGKLLGTNPYGYTSFYFDLTPHLKPGENAIAVRVRNEGVTSRWYPGSGIYRNVWLTKTSPERIRQWGVRVLTPEASEEKARVIVQTEVEGHPAKAELRVSLLDSAGQVVASGKQSISGEMTPLELQLKQPHLWDPEHPHLYTAQVQLYANGALVDQTRQAFGIRTIRFTAEKGFELNGRRVKMWGGCLHHDNGLLGAAAFARAETRKLEIMKANGYNAVRTAHNPMSDDFYDTCDRIGLLVFDEIFDVWTRHKTPQDYGEEEWEQGRNRDLELWLRRTRNHPSIVIRSLGNEIGNREGGEETLIPILKSLLAEAKRWDDARPYTGGNARSASSENFMSLYDVKGLNYREGLIDKYHESHPDWVFLGTESNPEEAKQMLDWSMIRDQPWYTGSFVWSGFEYIGEGWSGWVGLKGETAGWPSYAAACGLIDITGSPKGGQLFRKVLSGASRIEVNVLEPLPGGKAYKAMSWSWPTEYPSWEWEGFEGREVQVRVMTRAPEVKLLLNGACVGTGTTAKDNIDVVFKIPYQPGELVAEGIDNGKEVCRKVLSTPGKAAALRLSSDRPAITTNGNDLAFVAIEVVDAQGRLVQSGKRQLKLMVTGAGALEACGNGDHKDVYSFRNPEACSTWRGRSLAILRPDGQPGQITLTVESAGLPAVKLDIPVAQ